MENKLVILTVRRYGKRSQKVVRIAHTQEQLSSICLMFKAFCADGDECKSIDIISRPDLTDELLTELVTYPNIGEAMNQIGWVK